MTSCRTATTPGRYFAWLMLVVLAAVGLSACSAARLLYENVDWLAFEALDERFDVRADQTAWVKERLAALHDWHRRTQLPAYRQTLGELAERLADGLQVDDLTWLEGRMELHRRALVERAVPDLAAFLADLDPSQRARYAEVSDESLQEAAEPLEWPPRRRQEERLDTFVERVETWTGDLDADQIEELERDLTTLPDIRAEWLEQRRARQQAFRALLAAQPEPVLIEEALYAWWRDLESAYPEHYVRQRRAFRAQLFALLTRLDARLTSRQRGRIADRLEGYVSTIDTVLAAR